MREEPIILRKLDVREREKERERERGGKKRDITKHTIAHMVGLQRV